MGATMPAPGPAPSLDDTAALLQRRGHLRAVRRGIVIDSEQSGTAGRPPSRDVGGISAELTPDEQARYHRRTRRAKESAVVEDYVELIADLFEQQGEVRAVDIARRLGVTHATVAKMIGRLREMGLVTAQPYRAVFLTESGWRLAQAARRRHRLVVELLLALGVPEGIAQADAEGIEHYCSGATLEAFERFLRHRAQGSGADR